MSRKHFQLGLSYYKKGDYKNALQQFTEALKHDRHNKYLILDSRSAVYLKLEDTKAALKDAKATIEAAPNRWQGYARAARVFFEAKKLDASLTMISGALDRLRPEETQRRESLHILRCEVEAAKLEVERRRRLSEDNMFKLPIELFSEIAKLAIQDNNTSPVTLSHVSKNWRNVVVHLPQLWGSLILTRRHPAEKAKLWIKRSKGKIKELSIRASVMEVPHWAGDCLDTLSWEYLRVFKVQQWDAVSFLRNIDRLDTLTNIEYFESDQALSIHMFPFGREGFETNLRHLIISPTSSFRMFEIRPLALQSLFTLSLHSVIVSNQNFLDVLRANPLLESLTLQNVHFDPVVVDDQNMGHLSLKRLSLKANVPDIIFEFRFPALEAIRVENNQSSALDRFLGRLADVPSTCLIDIALCSCLCSPEPLVLLLRASPSLQRLEINNISRLASLAIEALAETSSSSAKSKEGTIITHTSIPTCPKLTYIDFSRCPDVHTGPLVRLIKSHRSAVPESIIEGAEQHSGPCSEITSLRIDECPHVDSAWLPWLRQRVANVSCVYMRKNAKFRH